MKKNHDFFFPIFMKKKIITKINNKPTMRLIVARRPFIMYIAQSADG